MPSGRGRSTGTGTAQGLTETSGAFWFFDATNLELAQRVQDGRSTNGAGNQKTYRNPPRHLTSLIDAGAFPSP